MKLLTSIGVGFNTQSLALPNSDRVIIDGGTGQIDGLLTGEQLHVGGWEAFVKARANNQPDPPMNPAALKRYFAKVPVDREWISNLYEDKFDEYSIGELNKALRAARTRGLKGVGHFGFPAWRFGTPVAQWQATNDRVMKALKPNLTMVNPQLYLHELWVKGATDLPWPIVLQFNELITEAERLAGTTEEVVPFICDRMFSERPERPLPAAPPRITAQIVELCASRGIKRIGYWSDGYVPAVGNAVLATVKASQTAGGVN